MNVFFCNVAEDITKTIPGPRQEAGTFLARILNQRTSLFMRPVTVHECIEIARNLKAKQTPDIYDVSTKLLKEIIDEIAIPLARAINYCFTTGTYPEELKTARVIPIYKTGDTNTPDNYRPISHIKNI